MNQSTSTRTYRGPSISGALEEIQRELGEEALVVSVREIPGGQPWQVWKPHEVEVVAIPPQELQTETEVDESPDLSDLFETVELTQEVDVQVSEEAVDLLQDSIEAPAVRDEQEGEFPTRELAEMFDELMSQGIAKTISRSMIRNASETLNATNREKKRIIRSHIKQQLAAPLKAYNSQRLLQDRVIFLIGARGAGKTTTTAKLAVYYMEELKKSVAWICADTIRAASITESRVYCDSLGISLMLAYTPEDLVRCVREAEADVVLVDTPGCNPYRESDVITVGRYLSAVPGRSTYLMVPASTKEADLEDMYAAFEPFRPDNLVLTKLDETGSYGSIYNFIYKSGVPLAYFATGPDVFDDLRPANPNRLISALLGDTSLR